MSGGRINGIGRRKKPNYGMLSSGSPDIFAFSADVKIIDRHCWVREAWEDFCAYLAEVNSQSQIIQIYPEILVLKGPAVTIPH